MDIRRDLDADADLTRPLHKQIHQVRIEALERARATVQDRHARAGASSHVSELEGDISATDKDEARRQRVELEKLFARGEILGTGKPHRRRHGAGRDQDPSPDEPIILHDQRRGPDEACAAVEQIDPRLGPALLGELGHRIGERALEPHELGPIDRQLSRADPSPGHALYRVNCFGRAHQDLLGIAAPQRARPAEGM